jgi:hypothetical protein
MTSNTNKITPQFLNFLFQPGREFPGSFLNLIILNYNEFRCKSFRCQIIVISPSDTSHRAVRWKSFGRQIFGRYRSIVYIGTDILLYLVSICFVERLEIGYFCLFNSAYD